MDNETEFDVLFYLVDYIGCSALSLLQMVCNTIEIID
jgi:hypothetical protein